MRKILKKNKVVFFVVFSYGGLLLVRQELAVSAIKNSQYYLVEMLQILPVIFMLTVAIDVLVSKEWIMKKLGNQSGALGGFLALAFGSLSAGPIYAAFPIVKMLHKKGASLPNIVIILSAWAVVKVPMLANEAKFLGPKFMLARWSLTVIFIFFIGWLMKKMKITIIEEEVNAEEKLYIKEAYCIGCGICAKMAPDYYSLKDNKAIVKNMNFALKDNKSAMETIRETIQKCPSKAIVLEE